MSIRDARTVNWEAWNCFSSFWIGLSGRGGNLAFPSCWSGPHSLRIPALTVLQLIVQSGNRLPRAETRSGVLQ